MFYFFKRYQKYLLILFCAIIIFVGVYVYNKSNTVTTSNDEKLTVTEEKETNEDDDSTSKTVFVDIKGAINTPGVYELENGKRIIDVINTAGGLTDNANTVNINLSKKLEDEMFIIIYTKEEIENYMKKQDVSEIVCASYECVCPDSNNDGCYKNDSNKTNDKTSSSNDEVKVTGKVSINTASKEELMTLSGIGEAKAGAIIEYREKNGNFASIEDIKNVSGIGDAIFEKIKDNITI